MPNNLPEYPRPETVREAVQAQMRNCSLYVKGTRERKAAERRLDRIKSVLNEIEDG